MKPLETDVNGHLKHVKTDPFGAYRAPIGIGSDDAYVCFDWRIANIPDEGTVFVLHSVIRIESLHYNEAKSYDYVRMNDPKFKCIGEFEIACMEIVVAQVMSAIDWANTGNFKKDRHNKKIWNQDEYYIVRECALALARLDSCREIPVRQNAVKGWNTRYGGKKINALCDAISDKHLFLPITRKPSGFGAVVNTH